MTRRVPITTAGRALLDMAADGTAIILEVEDELLGIVVRHFEALDQSNPFHVEAAHLARRVVVAIREEA